MPSHPSEFPAPAPSVAPAERPRGPWEQSEREQAGNQAADRRARLNVRLMLTQQEQRLKELFSSPQEQEALHARTEDLVRRMEGDDTILRDRARALHRIQKLATPAENRKFNGFALAMACHEELAEVEHALSGIYKPQDPAYPILVEERNHLHGLLAHMDVTPAMLQNFLDPFPKSASRKALDKDLRMMGRAWLFLIGGLAAAGTAILAKLAGASYNATLLWLLPTVISAVGMERLLGSRVKNCMKQLAFMGEKEPFVTYASKFPCELEGPARELVTNKREARSLMRVMEETKPKSRETQEEFAQRKEEARENMKGLLNPGRGKNPAGLLPGIEDRMLQDEEGFLAFAYHLVEQDQSDETLNVVYSFLRDGKRPAGLYDNPPHPVAMAGGGTITRPPSS